MPVSPLEHGTVSPTELLLANAVVLVGSVLQGSIGFGLGLFASPLLLLIDERLVPAPLLLTSGVLTILLTHREREAIIVADLKWSLGGRVLGAAVAALALLAVPGERLGLVLGAIVLLGVALTASGWRLHRTPRLLVGAGTLSGFMATTAGVGGPPMALVYQHESGPRIRGTLSAYFLVGVVISLVALGAVGRFGPREAALAGGLLPGSLAGFWMSRHTAPWLDRGYVRPAVLVVSAASGVGVILKTLSR